MELKQYLAIIWKWVWLIIACVTIAAVSSYLATRAMPPVYQATTTVRIGQSLEKPNPTYQDLWTSEQLAQTYAEIVRRRPILEGVAKALNLGYTPSAGSVLARRVANTQLLEISVRHTDPALAQSIANEIAHQLILQSPTSSEAVNQDREFILTQINDLKRKIEDTQAKLRIEQGNLDAAESARAVQQYQANISALDQKLSSYQANYASLLSNLQGGNINYISIVEPAQLPSYPIGPRVKMNIMLASAIGAVLAIGAAFLLEYLDDTVKTPEDVERVMGLTTLGAISRIENVKEEGDALIASTYPKSPVAEAYRVLRTNLQFTSVGNPVTTLMVTSASAQEGKTTTLANLGVAIAQAGKQVILVDTDLRRPSLHKLFGLPNSIGLTNMLLDESLKIQDVVTPTEMSNLQLLCSGPRPPNPAELLELRRMDDIIAALKTEADVVIFDSPPVLAVADATILSTKVQGVLMVVEMGRTRTDATRRAMEALRQVDARVLGVAMNKITRQRGGYYYYYYYYDSTDSGQVMRRRRRRGLLGRLSPLNPFKRPSPPISHPARTNVREEHPLP